MAAYPQSCMIYSLHSLPSNMPRFCWVKADAFSRAPPDHRFFSVNLKFISSGSRSFRGTGVGCRSTGDSGENESRTILDAFFLGKALAETLNERVESYLGEFLSTVGRLQAEQQKQIQEFQEEVLEKARRAKEQAAREGKLSSKSSGADESVGYGGGEATEASSSAAVVSISEPLNENPVIDLMNED